MTQADAFSVEATDVLGRRIIAHCIDFGLLVLVLAALFGATLKFEQDVSSDFCDTYESGRCVVISNQAVVYPKGWVNSTSYAMLGYWTVVGVIEGTTGAFVGKRLTRLRVVAREGGRAGPLRGAVRGALMFIDSSFCFLIGLLLVVFSRPRVRLGDRWARTFVIAQDSTELDANADPIQWDETKGVYVFRDAVSGEHKIWDTATERWIPLD